MARWIRRSRRFFSGIRGIGTGDPLLGPLPRTPQAEDRLPDGFVTDELSGDPLGEADLGDQVERPETGRLAKGAGALVQQRPQGLADARGKDRGEGMGA